jgi:hypothetical protein
MQQSYGFLLLFIFLSNNSTLAYRSAAVFSSAAVTLNDTLLPCSACFHVSVGEAPVVPHAGRVAMITSIVACRQGSGAYAYLFQLHS